MVECCILGVVLPRCHGAFYRTHHAPLPRAWFHYCMRCSSIRFRSVASIAYFFTPALRAHTLCLSGVLLTLPNSPHPTPSLYRTHLRLNLEPIYLPTPHHAHAAF